MRWPCLSLLCSPKHHTHDNSDCTVVVIVVCGLMQRMTLAWRNMPSCSFISQPRAPCGATFITNFGEKGFLSWMAFYLVPTFWCTQVLPCSLSSFLVYWRYDGTENRETSGRTENGGNTGLDTEASYETDRPEQSHAEGRQETTWGRNQLVREGRAPA